MTAPLDSLGMIEAARRVAEATETAMLAAQDAALPIPGDLRAVVVTGHGAAGWSAEVAAAIVRQSATVPVIAAGQPSLPAFVDSSTLVVEIGNGTEPALVVGGQHVALGVTVPHERAALGALVASALTVLERTGTVGAINIELDHAVAQLHRRRNELVSADGLVAGSDADRLARRIGRLFPLVYGEGDIGHLAALRWKLQINVNAKAPAYAGSLPQIAYDELAGFGQHGDVTRQVMCAVVLRRGDEVAPAEQFALLDEVLVESVASVHEVRAQGTGPLAQLLDLAYVGDVVSLHLAVNEGLDPGPAPFVLR